MAHSKVFVLIANLDYYKPYFCFALFQPNRTAEIQRASLPGITDVPPASIFNQHICFSSEGYPLRLIFSLHLKLEPKNPKVPGIHWKHKRVQKGNSDRNNTEEIAELG